MLDVNVSTVKSDIKTFNTFSDEHVAQSIAQAKVKAKADGVLPDDDIDLYNLAVLDYTRHLLAVDFFQNYGVVSANDLGQSETLANPNANDDSYLQAYRSIVNNDDNTGGTIEFSNGVHMNYLLQQNSPHD